MKEFHKSLEAFEKGIKLDANNTELQEGLRKTMFAINVQSGGGDEQSQQERAQRGIECCTIPHNLNKARSSKPEAWCSAPPHLLPAISLSEVAGWGAVAHHRSRYVVALHI